MTTISMSDRGIKALAVPTKPQVDYYDDKNPRFGLRVSKSGTKTWFVFDNEPGGGRRRRVTLGRYPEVSLSDARQLALNHKHSIVVDKVDPVAEKKLSKKAGTFEGLVDFYIERHAKPNKKSWKEDDRILRKYFAAWMNLSIKEINKPDVVNKLQDIKNLNGGVMANRSLAVVRKMYNWAIRNGYADYNPCHMVDQAVSEKSRERVYSDAELAALWEAFDQIGIQGKAYMVAALTGQRLAEIKGMKWQEINENVWTLPPERTKNSRTHIIPLSEFVLSVIEKLRIKNHDFVFASPRGLAGPVWLGSKVQKRVQKLSGVVDFTPHDLRRTLRTNVTPLGFDRFIGERVLNHTEQGVSAIYDRYDYLEQKRDFLEAWSRHMRQLVET
jgi:integrase